MPSADGPDRAPTAPIEAAQAEPRVPGSASAAGAPHTSDLMRDMSWPVYPNATRTWPNHTPATRRSIQQRLRHTIRIATITAQFSIVALIAYAFLFNFSVVRDSSMAPRIHDGDRIFIDHLTYL